MQLIQPQETRQDELKSNLEKKSLVGRDDMHILISQGVRQKAFPIDLITQRLGLTGRR